MHIIIIISYQDQLLKNMFAIVLINSKIIDNITFIDSLVDL